MTKPIIVVKMPKLLIYIIQVKVKDLTSWLYLISKFLVAYNHLATMLLLIGLAFFYSQATKQ